MINYEKLSKLTEQFNQDRNEAINGLEGHDRIAAMAEYDSQVAMITQREQLISIGVNSKDVEHNLNEIIEALELIGVTVLRKNVPDIRVVGVLEQALDDLVPLMWKCEGYFEVIDADPKGEFLSRGMFQLKQLAFAGAVSLDPEVVSLFK